MGLFEDVQLDLFELLGFPNRGTKLKKNAKIKSLPQSFSDLTWKVQILRKAHLKRISFYVDPKNTLIISANKTTSESELLSLIQPHTDWIEAQMEAQKKCLLAYPQKLWKSGERFPFDGKDLELRLSPSGVKKPFVRFMSESFEYFYPDFWDTQAPEEKSQNLKKHLLEAFKQKASLLLNEKVNFWSQKMELYPKHITYRNQKGRWGSCSSTGHINLNWKIACFHSDIQDYVIIHELAHLKHQNHSKNFWNLVEIFHPERKKTSLELHKKNYEVDCFLKKSELYDQNPVLLSSQLNL